MGVHSTLRAFGRGLTSQAIQRHKSVYVCKAFDLTTALNSKDGSRGPNFMLPSSLSSVKWPLTYNSVKGLLFILVFPGIMLPLHEMISRGFPCMPLLLVF